VTNDDADSRSGLATECGDDRM